MALLNDLKKLLFGAKAVTQSAADKAYEAGKEAGKDLTESGSEFFEKAKDKVEGAGKIVMDKADKAMEQAGDFAEDVGSKVMMSSESLKAKAKEMLSDEEVPVGKPVADSSDIMDDIIAETKTSPAEDTEEMLELPPLKGTAEQPKAIEQPEEEDIFDSLKKSATTTGAAVLSKSGDALEKAGGIAEGVGKKVMESGSGIADKLGETAEKVGGTILDSSGKAIGKAADFTENVGKKVMEKGSDLADKFGETAGDVGEALFEKGGEALEKAKGFASDLGSKITQAKDDLFAKAEAEAAKSGDTADSLIDKMKDLNQKLEDKISGNNEKFADKPLDTGGSEFAKHDSFWEKADKFAKGDYHMKGKAPKPGEMTIKKDPEYKAPEKGKVKGFDDHDGDGDELIDDAIVEE
ncbi:MAG: hypothetical protein R2830_21950 [Saprospiraceae bacterium]